MRADGIDRFIERGEFDNGRTPSALREPALKPCRLGTVELSSVATF